MRYAQVSSKTYRDNTGRSIDFPTLLVEHNGETMFFEQLHTYQIKNRSKSRTWHKKLVQAVGLLLDYMEANQEYYSSPKEFFKCNFKIKFEQKTPVNPYTKINKKHPF